MVTRVWRIVELVFLLVSLNVPVAAAAHENNVFNEFTFKFYKEINGKDKNLVFSPFSISSVLFYLRDGASGDTLQQFNQLFSISQQSSPIEWLTNLKLPHDASLILANSFWASESLSYNPTYITHFTHDSNVQFNRVNFSIPDNARQIINNWVEKQTHSYIKNLIPKGNLAANTTLVLVNAIYFKGLWAAAFKRNQTQPDTFFLKNKKVIQVPMMHQNGLFYYSENAQFQLLRLPYKNSTLEMVMILPRPNVPLEKIILNQSLLDLISVARKKQMDVKVPKFKIESIFNFNDALQKLGLKQAFTDQANFSKMTKDKLFVSSVFQKAYIQVDEQGTIAAAASGAIMMTSVALPLTFHANRPFVFLLYDKQTQTILFVGQVTNPRAC